MKKFGFILAVSVALAYTTPTLAQDGGEEQEQQFVPKVENVTLVPCAIETAPVETFLMVKHIEMPTALLVVAEVPKAITVNAPKYIDPEAINRPRDYRHKKLRHLSHSCNSTDISLYRLRQLKC